MTTCAKCGARHPEANVIVDGDWTCPQCEIKALRILVLVYEATVHCLRVVNCPETQEFFASQVRACAEAHHQAMGERAMFDTTSDDDEDWDDEPAGDPEQPFRPFAQLPDLPDDLAEACESFKLAIVRHKLAQWTEVSRSGVLDTLAALKALAKTEGT